MRLVLFFVALFVSSALAGPAHYQITVPAADATHVEVSARFVLTGEVVGMYVTDSPDLPNGTADLLEDLEAERADGFVFPVEDLGMGDWKLVGGRAGDAVEIRYRIRLEHDRHAWGPGIDEVAYRTDDGLFFVGFALFVIPFDGLTDGVTIGFDLPDGWRASAPWTRDGALYRADAATLLRNCFFVGTHHEETVSFDDFTFVLALGRDLADRGPLFAATMRPVLPRAKALFGGMPNESRYLVVVNRYPRTDGGAFAQSYSMLIDGAVNEASASIWGHGMVHEVLHFWNGHTLRAATAHEEWFREGITDYLTVILRAQLGLDRPEVTWRKFENALRRVLLSRMMMGSSLGIDVAGEHKHQNRMLVYGGGLLAGLALDVELRRATAGDAGLPDVLRILYRDFARAGKTYTNDDLRRIASELAGRDLTAFFDEHVHGGALVDHGPVFAALGLQLDAMLEEIYLTPAPDATPDQRALREALLGS